MNNDISNEKLVKIYKEFYEDNVVKDYLVDMELLINLYTNYLELFLNENGTFYRDVEFLYFVVNGFKYMCKKYLDTSCENIDNLITSICRHEKELRGKYEKSSVEKVNCSESDFVLIESMRVVMIFMEMGLIKEYANFLEDLFYNSYVIEDMNKGCEKSGVEYRKCKD